MSKEITILAIDPGYDRVGWAILIGSGSQVLKLAYGLIQTSKDDLLIQRYQAIEDQLTEIIKVHQPSEAAVETLFFSKNTTTAMHVAEARGIIIGCLYRNQVNFFEYNPMQIKQAITGYGNADKAAVTKMVILQLRTFLTQTTSKVVDDTMDAIALALTHLTSRRLNSA